MSDIPLDVIAAVVRDQGPAFCASLFPAPPPPALALGPYALPVDPALLHALAALLAALVLLIRAVALVRAR